MITHLDIHAENGMVRSLAAAVSDIVLFATPSGAVVYANPHWELVTGQSAHAAYDDGYLDTIHADDRALFIRTWSAAKLNCSEQWAYLRLRRKDGGYRHNHMICTPLKNEGDGISGWLFTFVHGQEEVLEALHDDDVMTQLLRELARRTPSLLFSLDGEGRIDFINDRWSIILGTNADAMLGDGWKNFVHSDDGEKIVSDLAAHFLNGEPYIAEWRIRRSDKTYRWVEIRAEAVADDNGRIIRWYGVGTDIDAKRRAIDALELLAGIDTNSVMVGEVDATLARIASAALAGMAEFAIFDISDADGRMRRIIVRALDRLSPSAVQEFSPPDLHSSHPIAQAIATRRSVFHPIVDEAFIDAHIEEEKRRASWYESQVRSIIVSPIVIDGRVLGALTLMRTVSNIPFDSQDVQVTEEVARRAAIVMENIRLRELAHAASVEHDEHFHRIADAIPQLMWIADGSGALEWVNKRWLDFTGRTLDEALSDEKKLRIYPDDMKRVWVAWHDACKQMNRYECEYRMVGRDGQPRWFLARATPVQTSAGLRWYGTNTDIDDARRAIQTSRIFADVGEALAESLGMQATLSAVMHIVTPELADWALITLCDEAGDLYVAKAYHPDEAVDRELITLAGRFYARGGNERGSPAALRHREPMLFEHSTYEDAAGVVERDVLDELRCVGYSAGIVIPLITGSAARGALTLFMSPGGRDIAVNDMPFYRELARRIAPAIVNAQVFERERRVAQSFQQAALPATLPTSDGYIFSAVYEAGRSEALVGGDWYDAFKLLDGRFIVSIGDVAGSGLRAAVMMANIRQAIRGVAHVHADPELMLEAADRALRSENAEFFATAFVGVVDPVADTIAYKSAGHPAPLLTTLDGRVAELRTEGLPLGLREPDRTSAAVHALPVGSVLILYTDGLTESTRDLAEGEARLREAVKCSRGTNPAERAQRLYDAVLTSGSRDDVAILCMTTVPNRRLYWTVDARDSDDTMKIREKILHELHARRVSNEPSMTAELVLAELIGNLVRYAPELAEILLEWDLDRAILHVRDNGPGFAFSPKLPNDVYSENGRGLFLIAALSDDFNVTRRPEGGSHARVVFKP